jgi:hypothetical protein
MNIKEAEIATIDAAIADKTDLLSVTTADIADRLKEIVDLLGAILVNPALTYNIGLIVYTASPFSVYVCKVDGATGDVTNQTNWLKIAGSGLPYLVADTEVDVSVVSYQASNYYVAKPIVLADKAGTLFDLRFSGVNATNWAQLAYAITISTTGSIEGSSIFIKTDNNGVGMSTLVIDGTYNERLEAGALYMFTRTTDSEDLDGYILTKINSLGIKILENGGGFTASTGKYITQSSGSLTLPLAVGLGGENVELILSSAGTYTVAASGSDTIVNVGGLSYNRPLMRFTSDGVNKWYYS